MSPEQFGPRFGMSGMTLRRWARKNSQADLPVQYEKALQHAVCELLAEKRLKLDSPTVKAIMSQSAWPPFELAAANLGISMKTLQNAAANPKGLINSLSQIGSNDERKQEVDKSQKKILSFKKMGEDWASRISTLLKVLKCDDLHSFEKLAAYGALFYLIMPWDLIPDHIPVFGLLDDFAILGFAVSYYLKRFPNLFDSLPISRE